MTRIKSTFSKLCTPILLSGCNTIQTPTQDTPIVMVHGIFDDGESFGFLKTRLQQAGYKCLAPDLTPNNGKNGLNPLAKQLDNYIKDELGEKTDFHLLGYSMGGLIARTYLKDSNNRQYCQSLTTLASPHHGTKLAHIYPLQAGIEMRPDSAYLKKLNGNQNSYHQNTLSIRTPYDGVIIPSRSSVLKGANNKSFHTPSHPSLLMSRRVTKIILDHLEGTSSNN